MNKTFYKGPSEGHKLIAANSSTFLLSAEKREIFNWVLRLDQKLLIRVRKTNGDSNTPMQTHFNS